MARLSRRLHTCQYEERFNDEILCLIAVKVLLVALVSVDLVERGK